MFFGEHLKVHLIFCQDFSRTNMLENYQFYMPNFQVNFLFNTSNFLHPESFPDLVSQVHPSKRGIKHLEERLWTLLEFLNVFWENLKVHLIFCQDFNRTNMLENYHFYMSNCQVNVTSNKSRFDHPELSRLGLTGASLKMWH